MLQDARKKKKEKKEITVIIQNCLETFLLLNEQERYSSLRALFKNNRLYLTSEFMKNKSIVIANAPVLSKSNSHLSQPEDLSPHLSFFFFFKFPITFVRYFNPVYRTIPFKSNHLATV